MKNSKVHISFLILTLSLLTIFGCKDEIIIPIEIRSDLTRTGKFVTFTSNLDGDYDIYLAQVDANGNLITTGTVYPQNPFNLTNSFNPLADRQSNWSPDGRVLVFSSKRPSTAEDIYAYFFNANGSLDSTVTTLATPRLLISNTVNWDENPFFSSNGLYLVYDRRYDNNSPSGVDTSDNRDLYIGDVSGSGNSFTVGNIRAVITSAGNDEFNPKWSPRISIQRVAYEYAGSATSTDHDVNIIDPLNPSNNIIFYNPGKSGYPAWAPTCNRIIFESDKGSGGFYQIVSLGYPTNNSNPGDIVTSAVQHLRYPTWLPNGNLLAYIRVDATTGNGMIYITSVNGGNGNPLLPTNWNIANNLWPAW